MNFVVKPYDSVELGQARAFNTGGKWRVWSPEPPHMRLRLDQPNCMIYNVEKDLIFFVVGPMDEDGFFKILLEDGEVVPAPIDQILTNSRLM